MTQWFDTHAHLNDAQFDTDRQLLIEKLPSLGIGRLVVIGYDEVYNRCALSVAHEAAYISAALGVHPHDADRWNEHIGEEIERLSLDPKVIAIGEIGLDYHYDYSPRETQRRVFSEQLALAKKLCKPVVVHHA